MTSTPTAPFGAPHAFYAFLRRTGNLLGKAFLAVALIFAAGIIAIATAAAGITLACVALLMRIFVGTRADSTVHENAEGATMTLEARKTPRGWTVE